MSSLFAAVLGVNPVQHLLTSAHALSSLSAAHQRILTGREFFPHLISGPFHQGLVVVFAVSAALSAIAAVASLLRGGRYVPSEKPAHRHEGNTMTLTTIDPNPALVVIDLQKGLTAVPTAQPIAEIIQRSASLAQAFRRHGLPVVLVNATGGAPGRTEAGRPSLARPCPRTGPISCLNSTRSRAISG